MTKRSTLILAVLGLGLLMAVARVDAAQQVIPSPAPKSVAAPTSVPSPTKSLSENLIFGYTPPLVEVPDGTSN